MHASSLPLERNHIRLIRVPKHTILLIHPFLPIAPFDDLPYVVAHLRLLVGRQHRDVALAARAVLNERRRRGDVPREHLFFGWSEEGRVGRDVEDGAPESEAELR